MIEQTSFLSWLVSALPIVVFATQGLPIRVRIQGDVQAWCQHETALFQQKAALPSVANMTNFNLPRTG